jgi:hypothetical protein
VQCPSGHLFAVNTFGVRQLAVLGSLQRFNVNCIEFALRLCVMPVVADPQAVERAAKAATSNMMSVLEARQVLSIATDAPLTKSMILDQFKRYYTANDPEKGGSLYLQAKIYNAKQALYEEGKFEETDEDHVVFDEGAAEKEAAQEEIETEKKKPE